MEKIKKLPRWIGIIVLFPLVFLWWLGLFISGIIIQCKKIKKSYPVNTIGALDMTDLNAVGERAFRIVAEKLGKPDAKWGP